MYPGKLRIHVSFDQPLNSLKKVFTRERESTKWTTDLAWSTSVFRSLARSSPSESGGWATRHPKPITLRYWGLAVMVCNVLAMQRTLSTAMLHHSLGGRVANC